MRELPLFWPLYRRPWLEVGGAWLLVALCAPDAVATLYAPLSLYALARPALDARMLSRCLRSEELLTTLSRRELVDGLLAATALRVLVVTGLPLFLASIALAARGYCAWALALIVSLAGLTCASSLCTQLLFVARAPRPILLAAVAGGATVQALATGSSACALALLAVSPWWLAATARAQIIRGLIAPLPAAKVTPRRLPQPWTEGNPLVARERRREPRGLERHAGLATLLASVAWLVSGTAIDRPNDAATLCIYLTQVLLVIFPLVAGARAAGSLAAEKEGRTLDALRLTRLTPGELVHGWAFLAWFPPVRDTLLVSVSMFGLMAWCRDIAALQGVPVPLGPLLLPTVLSVAGSLSSAYVGLAASACSGRPASAQAVTLGLLFVALVFVPQGGWASLGYLLALAALACLTATEALRSNP